jgi:hypothetical protein
MAGAFFAVPTGLPRIGARFAVALPNDANFCSCLFVMGKFRADRAPVCCAATILPSFCAGTPMARGLHPENRGSCIQI